MNGKQRDKQNCPAPVKIRIALKTPKYQAKCNLENRIPNAIPSGK